MAATRSVQCVRRWIVIAMSMIYLYLCWRLFSTSDRPHKLLDSSNTNTVLEDHLESFKEKRPSSDWHPEKLSGEHDFSGTLPKVYGSANVKVHKRYKDVQGKSNSAARLHVDDQEISKHFHSRRKLQEKLDEVYQSTGKAFDGNIWELSDYIPQWMKDYFVWHKKERKKLTKEYWDTGRIRVIVMQCLRDSDTKCGGTADRLKPFLLILREAHESKRLLLIHWTLPAALEEFLVPPMHGVDWRSPEWFSNSILYDMDEWPGRKIYKMQMLMEARGADTRLFRSRIQSVTGGSEHYDQQLFPGEPSFEEVYHDVWRVFFTPSAPIRSTIESYMEKWNLSPGEYAAAHLRALYGRVTNRSDEQATRWAQNAINCASTLRPGGPFLFSSDHSFSTESALAYGITVQTKVVARPHDTSPLHLDNAENARDRTPSAFYDVFVDLYSMGMSRCLTFNRGGFGSWALLIGYNSTCSHNQKTSIAGIGEPCNWTKPLTAVEGKKRSNAPLFVSAMMEEIADTAKHRKLTSFSGQYLPVWMTEYFAWHGEAKSKLTLSNWNETKYLIMVCEEQMTSCGGISDRLKPLPFVVLQAARHKRLLFIDWHKPKALQEYMVPPSGGVDWRLPGWLRSHLRKSKSDVSYGCDDLGRKSYIKADDQLIRLRIQTSDAGEAAYANQPDSFSTYADVFHGLFRAFFIPSPRLEGVMEKIREEHAFVPGEYAAVHMRNMYGKRLWRDPNETIGIVVNGVNCASALLPGAPIYYAADDKFAVEAAREYGRQRSLPVGSLESQGNPIHIDKDDEWAQREPSEYDDTFVDLFMLGQARCVAHSNGGYGSFGALLSYSSNCGIRYFKGRKTVRHCSWVEANGEKKRLPPPEMQFPPELYIKPD